MSEPIQLDSVVRLTKPVPFRSTVTGRIREDMTGQWVKEGYCALIIKKQPTWWIAKITTPGELEGRELIVFDDEAEVIAAPCPEAP